MARDGGSLPQSGTILHCRLGYAGNSPLTRAIFHVIFILAATYRFPPGLDSCPGLDCPLL